MKDVVFWLGLAVVAGLGLLLGGRSLWHGVASLGGEETSGQVVDTEIDCIGPRGDRPIVTYTYTVEGQTYTA